MLLLRRCALRDSPSASSQPAAMGKRTVDKVMLKGCMLLLLKRCALRGSPSASSQPAAMGKRAVDEVWLNNLVLLLRRCAIQYSLSASSQPAAVGKRTVDEVWLNGRVLLLLRRHALQYSPSASSQPPATRGFQPQRCGCMSYLLRAACCITARYATWIWGLRKPHGHYGQEWWNRHKERRVSRQLFCLPIIIHSVIKPT